MKKPHPRPADLANSQDSYTEHKTFGDFLVNAQNTLQSPRGITESRSPKSGNIRTKHD
jgi:hypothetical protein